MSLFSNFNDFSSTEIIKSHLIKLTKSEKYRNHLNIDQLNKTADFIKSVFKQYTDCIFVQEYFVDDKTYKNIICSFGTENRKRIVIGAHYDVFEDQEGADDNASGVVGLLELARLLRDRMLNYRIDLVAFSLEEEPYFKSKSMGSYIHAKSLIDINADVYGMVCLEMIGCFKDERHSQTYPMKFLSLIYGNQGDFIILARKFASGKFVKIFCKQFKLTQKIKTKEFIGLQDFVGIDRSDHINYWKFGISALMITDTAFYRNENYHKHTDTWETLDLKRMARVIDGIFMAISTLV